MGDRRERALFAGGVAVLVGAALLAYWLWLGRGAAGRAPGPNGAPAAERLRVVAVAGEALIRHAGASQGVPVQPGDELLPEDAVETGPDGVVQLTAGESYRVDLEENSKFAVREITAELSRFRLAEGFMSARVRDDPARTFEVEAGPEARARTRGGELSIAASESATEVAVRRGEAELASAGRAVVIKSGQRALALRGAAPSTPAAVPTSLLLKVAWPREPATNRRRLVVSGRTSPGALLALEGKPVRVNPDGSFRHVVYLREGRQKVSAIARDASGHRSLDRSPEILLDTLGVPAEFDTDRLWGNEGSAPTGGRKPSP